MVAESVSRKYFYIVDRQKYETDSSTVTGAEIKAKIPNFDPQYSLWLESRGNDPDRLVQDTESFALERQGQGELHFYTVPPASFGMYARH